MENGNPLVERKALSVLVPLRIVSSVYVRARNKRLIAKFSAKGTRSFRWYFREIAVASKKIKNATLARFFITLKADEIRDSEMKSHSTKSDDILLINTRFTSKSVIYI